MEPLPPGGGGGGGECSDSDPLAGLQSGSGDVSVDGGDGAARQRIERHPIGSVGAELDFLTAAARDAKARRVTMYSPKAPLSSSEKELSGQARELEHMKLLEHDYEQSKIIEKMSLERALLISRLEAVDKRDGPGGYKPGPLPTEKAALSESRSKSLAARPGVSQGPTYVYDDRRPERFLKPDFANFNYLPDIPLPTMVIDVVVSLKSIDSGYKKIERVIIANAMPDIMTTGSHVIKMDYLDYRTSKMKFIFTTAQLWGEFCAVINIDKGGRDWLNGTDPEIEGLEAAMFAIMIRLFSNNPANRDLESELTQTQTTPAGLLIFMDTRFGYISNEREFQNIRFKIVNKAFNDKDDLKKYLSSLRRESTVFNRVHPQLKLEMHIADINDAELMRGVIEGLPTDFKIQINAKMSPTSPEFIDNLVKFEAVLDSMWPDIMASRNYASEMFKREMDLYRKAHGNDGQGSSSQGGEIAFLGTNKQNKSNIKCFNCGLFGHISKECDKPQKRNNNSTGNRNNGRGGDRGGFQNGNSIVQMSEEQARSNYRGPPELFDPHFHRNRGQNNGHRGGYSNVGNRNVQSNMGDRSQDPRVQGRPQQPLALTQTPHTAAAAVCLWEGCGSTLHTQKDCPVARAHYAAQPQTVSYPSSSESARVAMPIIPPAPLIPEHETATFMFGGHHAHMAIINDVSDYNVSIDSSNQMIVTSTSTSKAITEMFYLPPDFVKPSYPIEYDDNEFVLERVNPVKRMVEDVPMEFKYLCGKLYQSWDLKNLDFFSSLNGVQGPGRIFNLGPLPPWTSDTLIDPARDAFCFGVTCVQRALKILKSIERREEVLQLYESCTLPSKGSDKMLGLDEDIKAQIDNWTPLEFIDAMAIATRKITKADLIKFIVSKLDRAGPTLSIGIAAFLIALKPEERCPIQVIYWNGVAWKSDIYGKNFPGDECFIAYSDRDGSYFPIEKDKVLGQDNILCDSKLIYFKQIVYDDPEIDDTEKAITDEASEIPPLIDEIPFVISIGVQPILDKIVLPLRNESLLAPYPPGETVARPTYDEGALASAPVTCTRVKPARYASGPRQVPGLAWQVKKTTTDL